jgi:hypothetical protein
VSWCPPGTTAEEIKASMRPPVLRKKQKGRQSDPVDREVRVLAFSAMTRAYERRNQIADEEVAADLVAMGLDGEGLPQLAEGTDDSSELSDAPESSTASSAPSVDSRAGGRVQDTPPTNWMKREERIQDAEAGRVGWSAGAGLLSEGRRDSEPDERDKRGKEAEWSQKADRFDVPTTREATALSFQHGSHSRANDQDEMVRRELIGLPDKRTRKPRQLFGEDVGTRTQL